MPLKFYMYSNEIIIENLKESLFQDDENAFNKLFGPFIIGNDSYDPDSVKINKDIEIKGEPDINFFLKGKLEDNNTEEPNNESEKSDSEEPTDENDEVESAPHEESDNENITHSHRSIHTKNTIARTASSSLRPTAPTPNKNKPKTKGKSKLKRKVVMV